MCLARTGLTVSEDAHIFSIYGRLHKWLHLVVNFFLGGTWWEDAVEVKSQTFLTIYKIKADWKLAAIHRLRNRNRTF